MRISDWSSDVCSSDLHAIDHLLTNRFPPPDTNHIALGRRSSPESSRLIRGRFAGPVVFHSLPAACFIQLGRTGRHLVLSPELKTREFSLIDYHPVRGLPFAGIFGRENQTIPGN